MAIPASWLPQQVSIEVYQGDTAYGPLYSSALGQPARVEFSNGITKDREGQDTVYNARIFLLPSAQVAPQSRITYTDSTGRSYSLIAITVAPMADFRGQTNHLEVEARYG